MGGLFNINSPFFRFMTKVFDIIMLSLLWTLCCIPIITIGPATSALYYAVVKSVRKDRGYPTKEFFKAFKMNFKMGTLVGIVLIVLSLLLSLNLSYAKSLSNTMGAMLWYIYLVLCVVVLMVSMYVYPVLSRFSLKFFDLLKMCFFFSIRHFLTTIVTLVIVAAGVLVIYISMFMGLFFVPGLCVYLISFLMERVLKRYTPEATEEDGPVDAWYLE